MLLPFLGLGQIQIGQDIDGQSEGDNSGRSVSLSSDGNIVAIGAPKNNGNGDDSGHVRIHKNENGVWTQIGQDIDGKLEGDSSGSNVSLSSDGSIVAVGAILNDVNGTNSGHVRIYKNQNGVWTQIGQDINGDNINNLLGSSISLSSDGMTVVIGAPGYDGNDAGKGYVRVFKNVNDVWLQIGDDIIGDKEGVRFGVSVSISSNGNIVAIGAPSPGPNRPIYDYPGYVKVYKNENGIWTQIGNEMTRGVIDDSLGCELSLSDDGSIVAIGVPHKNGESNGFSIVKVYKLLNNEWIELGQQIQGGFGFFLVSLSSQGDILAIGTREGNVRVFKNVSDVWTQIGETINDHSGWSVSLSSDGTIVAIGAPLNDENGSNSGSVQVYSIASELAIFEVVEDIAGNSNGINTTANQLNSITGVSGAIEGVNYTTALDNGTFVDENNPTALEIQTIIDQVNTSLSIASINDLTFNLYPNPTKIQFTIQLENTSELQNVNIYNNLGQLVLASKEATIDTSKLASGLYVVEIQTNKGKGSKKLIIE